MQRLIELQHKAYDFNCMISGLENLFGQKTGIYFPEYFLFLGSFIGFRHEICPLEPVARRVESGYGIGRGQYQFLSEILGFDWHMNEGDEFELAWEKMRGLINQGKPAILGELDMFHLPYLKKFYHRIHVPIHYITLIGYNEDRNLAFVQDCGKCETQQIPLSDLKKAFIIPPGSNSQPNTFFWFDFECPHDDLKDPKQLMRNILQTRSVLFLNSADTKQGIISMGNLIKEFPLWQEQLTPHQFKESLNHLVTYSCSLAPMPPQKLVFFPVEPRFKSHQAMRDRFAFLLKQIELGDPDQKFRQAADLFEKSGVLFQEITDFITDYLASIIKTRQIKMGMEKVPQKLEQIADIETQAFSLLAQIPF